MESKKKDSALVRSSAAEYLTFVASTGEDKDSIEMRYEDENIWLTQKMMATLYDVGLPTINEHIKKIYADHEQDEAATIRKFRIVQNEGGRQVTRSVNHYNLQMIIAVGFKVNNQRAVRFRVWANQIVEQYTIKGWAMDEERLKNGEQVLGTMVTTFASPDIAKILQSCGFDFFIVDCEHGAFTTREAANIIAVARGIGMPALVRIPEMRREHALKFMEMGASGLLLPNTETAEQARMLVDCTKYAPMGHRGVSLSRPHTDFKRVDGREYMRRANEETILMCQIESRKGVENIGEIMAVEGIDVGFIGPNDMTQDYGILNQFGHPDIVAAFEKVIAAAEENGKWAGVHFGAAEPLKPWLARGMQMNMWNSDNGLLALGASEIAGLRGKEQA